MSQVPNLIIHVAFAHLLQRIVQFLSRPPRQVLSRHQHPIKPKPLACHRTCHTHHSIPHFMSPSLPPDTTSEGSNRDTDRPTGSRLSHVRSYCRRVECLRSRIACHLVGTWDCKERKIQFPVRLWTRVRISDLLFLGNECRSSSTFSLGREISTLLFELFGFLGRHRRIYPDCNQRSVNALSGETHTRLTTSRKLSGNLPKSLHCNFQP